MFGFIYFYLIFGLILAIVLKVINEKPKTFFIIYGGAALPALAIFAIAFPHVLLKGM